MRAGLLIAIGFGFVLNLPDAQGADLPPAATIYIALNGNDQWSGKSPSPGGTDGPLRTLFAAQQHARVLSSTMHEGQGGIRVVIEPGRYELGAPLVFGPEDSGRPDAPTVYMAAEPDTVTLSGGQQLQRLPSSRSRREVDFASPVADAAFWKSAPQLYVNGKRAVLAREPKEGTYWFVGQPVAVAGEPQTAQGQDGNALGREAFLASPQALSFLAHLSASDRDRAVVDVMQSWSSERHRIAPSAPTDAIRVSPPAIHPFLSFGPSQRFFIENVEAALDAPGEWIGTPEVVRYLVGAEAEGQLQASLSRLEHIVLIRGAGPAGPYVRYLQLTNLSFDDTLVATPAAGWVDTQAAVDIGAAIEVDFARDIALRNCSIESTGGYGVWLRDGVRDSLVADCAMKDLGAGGVKVGTVSIAANEPPTQTTGNDIVSGNSIEHTGRIYPGAVGIWVGRTFDNEVSHNTIVDTTYTGISVGWKWGYGPSFAGRNRIVSNALLDIGGRHLADMGGIYTLGDLTGSVISDNLIREVHGYQHQGSGAWGIYNDEGTSGVTIENNIVDGTDAGAYHLHYGHDLILRHNLFADGRRGEIQVTRSEPERTHLAVLDNLIIAETAQPFVLFAHPPDARYQGDFVAPARPGVTADLQACAGGCVATTARLTWTSAQALTLEAGGAPDPGRWVQAAAVAGVQAGSGTRGAGSRATRVAASSRAELASVPSPASDQAPPLNLALDLQTVPEHGQPPGWQYQPPPPSHAMEAINDSTAPGQRCLALNDSPDFPLRFEPYLFAVLNHDHGETTANFDVRIDDNSELIHEWRDDATPYHSGPVVRFTKAGVEVAGRIVAPPIPPGQWRHVIVNASETGHDWQLQVTGPDGKVHRAEGLPYQSPDWHTLTWMGFVSNANVRSVSCLARVSVTSSAH
jgi:hypothetical protein